jgi:acyl-coenzyme A synthetase/AMP-(fatty) acid ligase
MICLWRGFHSLELPELIQNTWERNQLLILCPPFLKDFSFIKGLPHDEIELIGDWDPESQYFVEREFQSSREDFEFPQTPVFGVFTTGTTNGSPRLILYSKENIINSLEAIRSVFNLSKIESLFCYPQPTHAFGLILGYLQSYLFKLKLITGVGKYSKAFHSLYNDSKSSSLFALGTPAHLEDLMTYVEHNHNPIGSYSCIVGGAKVSVNHWNNLQQKLFIDAPSIGYGASEASLGIMHLQPGIKPTEDGEIGKLLAHIEAKYKLGEGLEVSGKAVCVATVQNAVMDFPKNVLIRDILDHRVADGIFLFRGRYELIINRGGFKFSLEQIEEEWVKNWVWFRPVLKKKKYTRFSINILDINSIPKTL